MNKLKRSMLGDIILYIAVNQELSQNTFEERYKNSSEIVSKFHI